MIKFPTYGDICPECDEFHGITTGIEFNTEDETVSIEFECSYSRCLTTWTSTYEFVNVDNVVTTEKVEDVGVWSTDSDGWETQNVVSDGWDTETC